MVQYKLTGRSDSLKVFRRFEVTAGTATLLSSQIVQDLKESIKQEFPNREFSFSVCFI